MVAKFPLIEKYFSHSGYLISHYINSDMDYEQMRYNDTY
ncbi:hypothetical protein AB84_4913 [Escherichia coli 2-052-05_S3_C1]|nr:hypothetical protein AB84_4913 [Escherichia coli 2-052-05_S3_C1]KDV76361.1 hypothetical protein AC42_4963 [Escherichia coli 2-052-05_S3_C3]KEN80919.1 hypothetical protein AC14_4969 [Escherichia coli 2-052-05_S3_C2]